MVPGDHTEPGPSRGGSVAVSQGASTASPCNAQIRDELLSPGPGPSTIITYHTLDQSMVPRPRAMRPPRAWHSRAELLVTTVLIVSSPLILYSLPVSMTWDYIVTVVSVLSTELQQRLGYKQVDTVRHGTTANLPSTNRLLSVCSAQKCFYLNWKGW